MLRLLAILSFGLASLASADVLYLVTVDTSSITSTYGSLDFNFNPGPVSSQDASLQIQNFSSDGTLDATNIFPTGDVSGTLPGTLTFDNQTAFNDYFEDFTFGSSITFGVYLYGPAIDSPDGMSYSGDTFTFSMSSTPDGATPTLTTDPGGTAFTINVNLDGSTTPMDNSTETTIALSPEPGTLILFGSGIAFCGLLGVRRRGAKNASRQ
jgi:hypothetical protein